MGNREDGAARRKTYRIKIDAKALKALSRLDRQDKERVIAAIDALAEDPLPPRCKAVKLAPKGTYRIRVGNYRVLYAVLSDDQIIAVSRIVRRQERTYQSLRLAENLGSRRFVCFQNGRSHNGEI